MKKKLNLAALLLAAALLGACGGQKQDAADTVAQTESAETENAADRKAALTLQTASTPSILRRTAVCSRSMNRKMEKAS